jgi:hypothetical protein
MLEEKVREAIIAELKRQAEDNAGGLTVDAKEDVIQINGPINVDDLVMVIVGSLAGGP